MLPLLEKALIKRLEEAPSSSCKHCDGDLRKNYCRRCGTAFWDGHAPDCIMHTVDMDTMDYHHIPQCSRVLEITYRQRFDADDIVC